MRMGEQAGIPVAVEAVAARDERIEEYLDRIDAPLIGHVPRARRLELRAELALHLDALVEAHQELGATPDEAVTDALRQFGDPLHVGQEWRQVNPVCNSRRSWLRGALFGALSGGVTGIVSMALFTGPLVAARLVSADAWEAVVYLGLPMGASFGSVVGALGLNRRQAAWICGGMPAALYSLAFGSWILLHPEQFPGGPILYVLMGSFMLLACGAAIGAAVAEGIAWLDRWSDRLERGLRERLNQT
jgi:hypothetical protein